MVPLVRVFALFPTYSQTACVWLRDVGHTFGFVFLSRTHMFVFLLSSSSPIVLFSCGTFFLLHMCASLRGERYSFWGNSDFSFFLPLISFLFVSFSSFFAP